VKKYFMKHHAELLTPQFWEDARQRLLAGEIADVFPYPQELRFSFKPLGTASEAA
jgi:isocitrate dehydrogenase kinase/phosphatase